VARLRPGAIPDAARAVRIERRLQEEALPDGWPSVARDNLQGPAQKGARDYDGLDAVDGPDEACTVNTGHGAVRTTFSPTLPSSALETPGEREYPSR
jgi:hypothetical protein